METLCSQSLSLAMHLSARGLTKGDTVASLAMYELEN